MICTSGQVPYAYESPRMPFQVCADDEVGFSGIFYEQAMFAIMAERRRYARNDDPEFFRYVNFSGVKGAIEPHASGVNLSGSGIHFCGIDWSASIDYIDYIIDMRNALSGLFPLIATDCDFSSTQVEEDYFLQLYPGTLGSQIRFYNNYDLPGIGPILDVSTRHRLGVSGVIFDVDLGEVAYQPYPHMAEFTRQDMHNANDGDVLDVYPIVSGPVFPAFQNTLGQTVATNARDDVYFNTTPGNNVDYRHVPSGVIRVDGDPLPSGTTFLRGEPYASLGDFECDGARFVGGGIFGSLGRSFIDPGSVGTGVYRVAARYDKDVFPQRAIASGVISIWPRESQYNDIGRTTAGLNQLQGYHVFDDAIWISDNGVGPLFPLSASPPSGLAVLSPHNGDALWVRLADLTNNTGGNNHSYDQMKGLERPSAGVIVRVEAGGVSDGAGNTTMTWTRFNDLLNRSSEVTTPSFNIGVGNSISCRDMFYDGTSYFILDANTSGDDIYEFDGSFGFVTSYEAGALHPLHPALAQNIERAAFIKGSYYHFGTSGAIHEFSLNSGAGTSQNEGNTRPLQTGSFASIIGTIDEVQDFLNVSGGTHVNDGCWFLIRNTSDVGFLVRVEENPPDFDIVEVVRIRVPEPTIVGEYRVITHMDIV